MTTAAAPAAAAERRLYTPSQAATYLGIGLTKLYELTRGGHLGCVEIPGDGNRAARRWDIADLDEFIGRQKVPARS